jgi:hypothetical protein
MEVSDKIHVIDDLPSGQEPSIYLLEVATWAHKTSLDVAYKPDNVLISKFSILGLSVKRKTLVHIM